MAAFNNSDRGIGLHNISIEFSLGEQILSRDVPGRETGEVRHGLRYSPPMTVLTLPAREWVMEKVTGTISGEVISKIRECDRVYLTADTTDGRHVRKELATLSV
jgi:hypothetical protein